MKIRSTTTVVVAMALALAACTSSSDGESGDTDAAAITTAPPITTTSTTTTMLVTGDDTEDPATDPAVLNLDDYLVAIINAAADAGACGEQAERDFNDAPPADHKPTEAEAVEGGKEYFGGQFGCQQIADDAIADLQPPLEAVSAHADLVAARQAATAAARAAMNAAETIDEITRAVVEPGPAVIEAYGNWAIACGALEDVAASNGIDATLDCPMLEPTGTEPVPTTTVAELGSLPVEMYLTLASYNVDEATGQCSGSGELSGVIEGSRVLVVDDLSGEEVESIVLPAGTEITRDTDPAFLFSTGQDGFCLFIDGLEVDHFDFRLVPESDPNVGVSGYRTGQRLVVVFDS